MTVTNFTKSIRLNECRTFQVKLFYLYLIIRIVTINVDATVSNNIDYKSVFLIRGNGYLIYLVVFYILLGV